MTSQSYLIQVGFRLAGNLLFDDELMICYNYLLRCMYKCSCDQRNRHSEGLSLWECESRISGILFQSYSRVLLRLFLYLGWHSNLEYLELSRATENMDHVAQIWQFLRWWYVHTLHCNLFHHCLTHCSKAYSLPISRSNLGRSWKQTSERLYPVIEVQPVCSRESWHAAARATENKICEFQPWGHL
jgi:hypothetical protein